MSPSRRVVCSIAINYKLSLLNTIVQNTMLNMMIEVYYVIMPRDVDQRPVFVMIDVRTVVFTYGAYSSQCYTLGYESVYPPLCKVADAPFYIQGDDVYLIYTTFIIHTKFYLTIFFGL